MSETSTTLLAWLDEAPMSRINYDDQANYYDALYGEDDEGWEFWSTLLKGDELVVEVGAGTGRLTRLLASTATSVVGIEPAPRLLERARSKLADATNVVLSDGNFRKLPVADGEASSVIYPYAVLAYALGPAEQLAVLTEAYRAVKPGGRVVIDLPYFPLDNPHTHGSVPLHMEGRVPFESSTLTIFAESSLDADWNVCRYVEILDETGENNFRRIVVNHDLHLFTPFELYFLVIAAGFRMDAMFGGFDRSLPCRNSSRLIAIGEKAVEIRAT